MSLLATYRKAVESRNEAWLACKRGSGDFAIFPTNKGGFVFSCKGKDIKNGMTVQELEGVRELITTFLRDVVGELE